MYTKIYQVIPTNLSVISPFFFIETFFQTAQSAGQDFFESNHLTKEPHIVKSNIMFLTRYICVCDLSYEVINSGIHTTLFISFAKSYIRCRSWRRIIPQPPSIVARQLVTNMHPDWNWTSSEHTGVQRWDLIEQIRRYLEPPHWLPILSHTSRRRQHHYLISKR